MYRDEQEDTTLYNVVVNHEGQYSIWPANRENPIGWRDVGKSGLKAECLDYIKEVWTDMRPLSLRKKMEEVAQSQMQSQTKESPGSEQSIKPEEDNLVKRLSEGDHPIEAGLRPEKSVHALKQCIDQGYIHIKFTNTRGGTELGVNLDREVINLQQADFNNQTGSVHLVGRLTLDYVKVRCIADIDLNTLTGKGHLEMVQE